MGQATALDDNKVKQHLCGAEQKKSSAVAKFHSSSFTEENHTRHDHVDTVRAAVVGINNNQSIYW